MKFGASLWEYFNEYLQHVKNPNVLVVVFEDLVKDIRGHLPVDQRKLGVYLSVVMKTQFGHQQRFLLGRAHVDQIRFAAPAIVSQGLVNTVLGLNV